MANTNIDTYSQKEIALDVVTLTGATVATSLASKVHLVNPLSVGTLVLTGANILALTAVKKLLDHKQIESKFLRACTIITALALTTLAIPLAIGTLCGSSIAILSLEVAIQTTLLHLATKVATYGLFRGGLLFKDFFFFSFPSSIHEITSLPQSRLEQVKAHLLDFPEKAKQIPLLFQLTLNQQLREHNLEPLPLNNFSERGENWTRNQLKELHKEDLRHLPLEKRAAVAELFFYHNLPPQGRPYEKDELPSIDYGVLKKLNASQLIWVHLIARLDPKAPVYEPVLKQFYRLALTPPRSSWIDLPQPTSVSEIQNLKASQIQWYANLFEAQRVKWERLPVPLQEAFNVRFATKRPIYGTAVKEVPSLQEVPSPQEVPSLLGRVKKAITWKRVAIAGGALAVTALIAAYYFRPELFHGSGGGKIVELATNTPSPALSLDPSRIAVSARNSSIPVWTTPLPESLVPAGSLSPSELSICLPGDAPPLDPAPFILPENLPLSEPSFCPSNHTPASALPKTAEIAHTHFEPRIVPEVPSPFVPVRNLSTSESPFCLPGDAPDPTPFILPANLPPSEPSFCPSNHTPASTLAKTAEIAHTHFEPRIVPEVPSHISLSSRISDFARTQFHHLGKLVLPGALLSSFIYWGLRYCMRPTAAPAEAAAASATKAQAAAGESSATAKDLFTQYLRFWNTEKREFDFPEGFNSQAFIGDMVRHTERFARADVDPNIHYGHAEKIDLDPNENSRIVVRADLHGDLYSLLAMLQVLQKQALLDEQLRCKSGVHLILLGDYGDRGSYTTQVLTLLMRLREENPKQVHLIQGNHEEHEVNRTDRFKHQNVKGKNNDPRFCEIIDADSGRDTLDNFYRTLPLTVCVSFGQNQKGQREYPVFAHASFEPGADLSKMLDSPDPRASMPILKKRFGISERVRRLAGIPSSQRLVRWKELVVRLIMGESVAPRLRKDAQRVYILAEKRLASVDNDSAIYWGDVKLDGESVTGPLCSRAWRMNASDVRSYFHVVGGKNHRVKLMIRGHEHEVKHLKGGKHNRVLVTTLPVGSNSGTSFMGVLKNVFGAVTDRIYILTPASEVSCWKKAVFVRSPNEDEMTQKGPIVSVFEDEDAAASNEAPAAAAATRPPSSLARGAAAPPPQPTTHASSSAAATATTPTADRQLGDTELQSTILQIVDEITDSGEKDMAFGELALILQLEKYTRLSQWCANQIKDEALRSSATPSSSSLGSTTSQKKQDPDALFDKIANGLLTLGLADAAIKAAEQILNREKQEETFRNLCTRILQEKNLLQVFSTLDQRKAIATKLSQKIASLA